MTLRRNGHALQIASLILVVLTTIGPLAQSVPGTEAPTHRVITYFIERSVKGRFVMEWRVFDPVSRVDTLFGALSARSVYWDTTESNAEYLSGDQLFRVPWEMGALPWPISRLPSYEFLDWWTDANTHSLRALKVRALWQGASPTGRCRTEMWQADRGGSSWRLTRADTTQCEDSYTYPGGWRVSDPPGARRGPAVGLRQLQDAMTIDAWGGRPEPARPPRGESATSANWFFIPCRSVPGRGLVFRIGRRPGGLKTFMAPFYLVDRAKGTQQMLDTPAMYRDQELWRMGMEEQDGVLLMSGTRTYVYDLRTGAQILSQPNASVRQAAWIKAPASPSVDSLGLRRLRERFR
jgi:hypothetical protein